MDSETEVTRDLDGGVNVTIDHEDGPKTLISADDTRTSLVLRFIASKAQGDA
jgi:hypothetical protein